MAINNIALRAYSNAMETQRALLERKAQGQARTPENPAGAFSEAISSSLRSVNELQGKKDQMITSFASGEKENVHELMISLQKASVAMSMTTTVRNKVLEAYKEILRTPL